MNSNAKQIMKYPEYYVIDKNRIGFRYIYKEVTHGKDIDVPTK